MASARDSADTSGPEAEAEAPEDGAAERAAEAAESRTAGLRLPFLLLRWSVVAIQESSQEGVSPTQEEWVTTRWNRGPMLGGADAGEPMLAS